MKALKRGLSITGAVLLAVLFAALIFRIVIAEKYPDESLKVLYTDKLAAYYEAKGGLLGAVTQDLRVPYNTRPGRTEQDTSHVDGAFFGNGAIWIPEAGNFQITVRYNDSSLATVEKAYREMGKDVTLKKAEEGLFAYRLFVCYYDEETKEATYRTFDVAAEKEFSFTIYHYTKLVFEEIPTEVGNADLRWMRLDVSLASETEVYGHIVAFETVTEISGQMVPVTVKPYVPGKDEIPQ
jgi:hypothetical protein